MEAQPSRFPAGGPRTASEPRWAVSVSPHLGCDADVAVDAAQALLAAGVGQQRAA